MTLHDQLRRAKFERLLADDEEPAYREHEWLVQEALHRPPSQRIATASCFSGWVFNLCNPPRADRASALATGKDVERRIEDRRKLAASLPDRAYPTNQDLEVVFADPLDGSESPLTSSALTVDDEPLRCLPDYVLRSRSTGEVYVFERKATWCHVPANGWPNLQAQLWCYGWIDLWRDAPIVYLLGDIWVPRSGAPVRSPIAPRWNRDDPLLNKQCQELFHLFGGKCGLSNGKRRGGAR